MEEIDNKEASDALHMLLHCSLKDTEFETQKEQFEIVSTYIKKLEEENKELKNKNMELKNTYIKVAKHQDKLGHQELAEYMLAQIELIPTFTTWENYYDFIPKSVIEEIIYPTPENPIEIEVQNSEMYKKLQELLEKGNS